METHDGESDPELGKRPKRIILVRHGESQGNVDESLYSHLADSKILLTATGRQQAFECGQKIKALIEGDGDEDWKVYFYVSPYKRTLQTLREIGRAIEHSRIAGVREEPRIREQDFGNFQIPEEMQAVKHARERFGKFFFRFPNGESAADVYDRVTGFLESLWRDISMERLHREPQPSGASRKTLNVVIVTHGLTMRVFLTRWFKWTTREFEELWNPCNCEMRVMQLGTGGVYSLAVHHDVEEMEAWGLTPKMIEDQVWRKNGVQGEWATDKQWNSCAFFEELDRLEEVAMEEIDGPDCIGGESLEEAQGVLGDLDLEIAAPSHNGQLDLGTRCK